MFFFLNVDLLTLLYLKKKFVEGSRKNIFYRFCILIVHFYKLPYYWESPTERGGEKKTLLPADDKSKSRDICLDMDINIYQTMKCCYTYIRILIYSYDMCFHAFYDLSDSCHLEVKVKEEKNKPYWMPIC